VSFGSIYTQVGFLPLVALTIVAFFRQVWKTRPFDMALSVLLAILSFFATRNVVLFSFAAMVPAALALSRPLSARGVLDRISQPVLASVVAVLIATGLFGWVGTHVSPPGVQWPGAFGSVQRLAALPGEHRLFCAEYSWCSIALGNPNIRIFLDGRADPYPERVWAADGYITRALPGWQQLMNEYDMNAVIAWRGGFFESRMQTLPQWKEITDTGDACCVLFVKNAP
jgi:hypothetical protein